MYFCYWFWHVGPQRLALRGQLVSLSGTSCIGSYLVGTCTLFLFLCSVLVAFSIQSLFVFSSWLIVVPGFFVYSRTRLPLGDLSPAWLWPEMGLRPPAVMILIIYIFCSWRFTLAAHSVPRTLSVVPGFPCTSVHSSPLGDLSTARLWSQADFLPQQL